jgi:hypothetical protein
MINKTVADITIASAGNVNLFAATVEPDPTGTTHALLLLSAQTNAHVCAMLRDNRLVAEQYYVIYPNKFTIISSTHPTIATNETKQAIYLASMGDQLDFPKPISLSVSNFEGQARC